jgi:hypothetical protein
LTAQNDRWPTKKAKKAHFSNVLQTSPLGEPLHEHYNDLHALLECHPAADEKIGAGVSAFKVDLVAPYYSRGFYIVRTDGTVDDFSYIICLNGRPTAKQKAVRAFRNEIFPQIDAFRRETFAGWTSSCAITGETITNDTSEVDHAPPNTFAKMMADFLSARGLKPKGVETISHDGGVTQCIVDVDLRVAWQGYHAANASLRAVSPAGHRLSHANDNKPIDDTTKVRSAA